MDRDGIVQPRADAVFLEVLLQFITILRPYDIKVINASTPLRLGRRHDSVDAGEAAIIVFRGFPSLRVPAVEMSQFYREQSGLKSIETPVVAFHNVVILLILTMVAKNANMLRDGFIIRRNRSGFTASAKVLPGIEAESR